MLKVGYENDTPPKTWLEIAQRFVMAFERGVDNWVVRDWCKHKSIERDYPDDYASSLVCRDCGMRLELSEEEIAEALEQE